ncbi:unnamed protein product [Bathycoccus prasinos]
MTKPKHLYVPLERTGAAVRTPAQLEALAKGRARYMEKEPPSPPPSPPPEPEEPEPVPEKPAPPPREPSPPPRPAFTSTSTTAKRESKALSKLYWVEFMKDNATSGVGDWSAKLFYIDLSDVPSYTQNAEIATFINDKLQNEVYDFDTKTVGTHSFGAEDPLEIDFVYDESNYSFSYTVSQTTLTQDLGVKVFSPLIYQNDAALWNHFGFNEINHMIALYSADYLTTPAQAVENLNTGYKTIYPLTTDVPAGLENYITYSIFNRVWPYLRIAGSPTIANSSTDRTSESDGHSTHENHFSQLYICSDTLGTDSMLCNNDTAVPTNILACVMNDQPKFSYLNFQTNTPAWNKLNDTKIQEFDIKIRDHRGRDIPTENLPNFNMTLVFETIDEIDYQKEHTKEYLREAYRKEHNYRK